MEFVSAIVETIKTQKGIINDNFYAILCDYRAFDDEEVCVKGIVKQICDNGFIIQLSKLSSSDKIWKNKMADMIYQMTNQYGYQKDIVSEVLHKLAVGFGIVDYSFDWEYEFNIKSNPSTNNSTKTKASGSKQGEKSPHLKWNNCTYCGQPYYKSYSRFCHHCGKPRK